MCFSLKWPVEGVARRQIRGIGNVLQPTTLIVAGANASWLVPTNNSLGKTWTRFQRIADDYLHAGDDFSARNPH
jgi:hypothetical protein